MMNQPPESFHNQKMLSLVNRYATPLAIILVVTAILCSQPTPSTRNISIAFLFFSVVFNFSFYSLFTRVDDHYRTLLAKFRATINLWGNALLVLLLGRDWPAMWLLLCLTGVATGIYGSRERTLATASFLAMVLLVINALLQLQTPWEWGQRIVQAVFIVSLSLLVNDLAHGDSASSQ
jgi:hypothetical protein